MSKYYKVPRGGAWNYGGKSWALSRSKIEFFLNCQRCFWIDNKHGVKLPPGYPFSLNSAVDNLLKNEFDGYRERGEQHPIQKQFNLTCIPAKHDMLGVWRENFQRYSY